MSRHPFKDRSEAGHLLARHLAKEIAGPDLVVIALPRGGVVVGFEIARYLNVPLDIIVVRKLGAPMQPELAIGAIASGGHTFLNHDLISKLHIGSKEIESTIEEERIELARRENAYLANRERPSLAKKKILIVDDGIATGATMQVAIQAVRSQGPRYLAVAVPVASLGSIELLSRQVDRSFVLQMPEEFGAVGEFYESFPPISDDEVVTLLKDAQVRLHHDNNHEHKT
jgi:putative phosphoribosyl transferase